MHMKPEKQQEKGLSLRLLLAGVLASLAAPAHTGETAEEYDAPLLPSGTDNGAVDSDVFIA